MSEKEYKTSEYVVAFIDILGATNAIKNSENISLSMVHQIYDGAIESFGPMNARKEFFRPEIKIFSDNIVVAVPYDDTHTLENAFLAVCIMSSVIQIDFLANGWLTRGGITAGSFFIDETMVWGKALVDAYHLESTVAYFPRVIVAPILAEKLDLSKLVIQDKNQRFSRFLKYSNDGFFFIDFLRGVHQKAVGIGLEMYKSQNILEKQLLDHKGNTKICQKWLWMDSYIKQYYEEQMNEGENINGSANERQRD